MLTKVHPVSRESRAPLGASVWGQIKRSTSASLALLSPGTATHPQSDAKVRSVCATKGRSKDHATNRPCRKQRKSLELRSSVQYLLGLGYSLRLRSSKNIVRSVLFLLAQSCDDSAQPR